MTRVLMQKLPQGALVPTDAAGVELLAKIKSGSPVWIEVVRARNTPLHRKWFALLGIGYEAWEPPAIESGPYAGIVPEKDFEVFRKDITKLAGFVDVYVSADGSAIVQARSVSFDRMEQDEFDRLFSATINVLLKLVLLRKTEAEVREWVETILRFDS